VAKIMEDFGIRVQKSVFECLLDDKQFITMKKKVEKVMDFQVDSVRYYSLCALCREKIELSGAGFVLKEDQFIII